MSLILLLLSWIPFFWKEAGEPEDPKPVEKPSFSVLATPYHPEPVWGKASLHSSNETVADSKAIKSMDDSLISSGLLVKTQRIPIPIQYHGTVSSETQTSFLLYVSKQRRWIHAKTGDILENFGIRIMREVISEKGLKTELKVRKTETGKVYHLGEATEYSKVWQGTVAFNDGRRLRLRESDRFVCEGIGYKVVKVKRDSISFEPMSKSGSTEPYAEIVTLKREE